MGVRGHANDRSEAGPVQNDYGSSRANGSGGIVCLRYNPATFIPTDVPSVANIICLVDDEASVLKSLGRLLASDGLHAEKFSDPASFLAHARSHRVHLAVIDIRMPGMTGFEVLSELRALTPAPNVIVMTGENDRAHREAALAGGACAFFRKPFEHEAFLVVVRQAIAPSA